MTNVRWCLEHHGCFNATDAHDRAFVVKCRADPTDGPKDFLYRWMARFLRTFGMLGTTQIGVNGDFWGVKKNMLRWYTANARLAGVTALGEAKVRKALAATDGFGFTRFLPHAKLGGPDYGSVPNNDDDGNPLMPNFDEHLIPVPFGVAATSSSNDSTISPSRSSKKPPLLRRNLKTSPRFRS